MTTGGVTTDFILDGQSTVREMRGGTKCATYLAGLRGVEYRRGDATGVLTWYIYDGLGSVLGEVNTAGEVVDSAGTPVPLRKLDVYGAERGTPIQSTGNHKFVGSLGHTTEDNTGLIYMRARYYDPAIGRFISEDPGRNGVNWYAYCTNNPVNLVDPDGRAPIDDFQTALLGVGCFSTLAIAGALVTYYGYRTGSAGLMVIGTVAVLVGGYLDYVFLRKLVYAVGELIDQQRRQSGLNLDEDVYQTTKRVRSVGGSLGGFGYKVAGYVGDVLYYLGVAGM